jgi:hypothetical protein
MGVTSSPSLVGEVDDNLALYLTVSELDIIPIPLSLLLDCLDGIVLL